MSSSPGSFTGTVVSPPLLCGQVQVCVQCTLHRHRLDRPLASVAMAPPVCNAFFCYADGCDWKYIPVCCKGQGEVLCVTTDFFCTCDERSLGSPSCVPDWAKGECCNFGLLCCSIGCKAPTSCCNSWCRCLCFYNVVTCPCGKGKYLKDWDNLAVSRPRIDLLSSLPLAAATLAVTCAYHGCLVTDPWLQLLPEIRMPAAFERASQIP
jgi:hypothetical protein